MASDHHKPATPRRPTPFDALLGTEVLAAHDGASEVRLVLTEAHRNLRGVAHGGVVSALLDMALGAAVVSTTSEEEWCGTLELSVQFRDPARNGPWSDGVGFERRGRSVAFAAGEVLDDAGRIVAVAHGVWTIWASFPDRPKPRP